MSNQGKWAIREWALSLTKAIIRDYVKTEAEETALNRDMEESIARRIVPLLAAANDMLTLAETHISPAVSRRMREELTKWQTK